MPRGTAKKRAKPKPIGRGSRVSFQLGASVVQGTVIDDLGPLGPDGIRILKVRLLHVDLGFEEPFEAEVLEDRLTAIA